MAAPTSSSQSPEIDQNESTGKIVFEVNEDFYNGYDNSDTWWDMYQENELEFCPVRNGGNNHQFEVQSDTVHVRGAEWYILGQLKDEDGLYVDCYNWDNFGYCEVYTLVLSLACAGCPDGKEFDVSGQMTVRAKSSGKNAKVFKFARTFLATKTEFLGDFVEINVFEDLKLKKDDRVIVEVAFSVEQRVVNKCSKEDLVMLKVNEHYMEVDKFLLAFHSEYFKTLFFGNRFPATEHKISLPESTSVEDFKQLVAILEEKSTLNDDSIQGTFMLANFFGFPKLEAKCRKFLVEDCRKHIIFKYQLADTCGLTILRDNILAGMTLKDVGKKETKFLKKCKCSGEIAFAAFDARLKELKNQESSRTNGSSDDYESEASEQLMDLFDADDDGFWTFGYDL